jgi:hypothetical protein
MGRGVPCVFLVPLHAGHTGVGASLCVFVHSLVSAFVLFGDSHHESCLGWCAEVCSVVLPGRQYVLAEKRMEECLEPLGFGFGCCTCNKGPLCFEQLCVLAGTHTYIQGVCMRQRAW